MFQHVLPGYDALKHPNKIEIKLAASSEMQMMTLMHNMFAITTPDKN